jgi:hypothetical protein
MGAISRVRAANGEWPPLPVRSVWQEAIKHFDDCVPNWLLFAVTSCKILNIAQLFFINRKVRNNGKMG